MTTKTAHASAEEQFVRDLYEQHGPLLRRYAARLLGGDWHRAEDILQETAARAWRHADTLGANAQQARPWLFTVVRNLVIDHHRACQIRPPEHSAIDALDIPVTDHSEHFLTAHIVVEALAQLSDSHREVIHHMHFAGHTVAQTSDYLGIPPGTVKSRTYYAMQLLRKVLIERGITGWSSTSDDAA
ncbi:sigma-70 family RNA polymerase sigma factor [Streptomyces zaomyceticus]|uniref:sigma-70 family RNA polymerase sigma factor n=1 Tax=Streptomyces zaomyceticus TaxID=68286 RepID=UPI00369C253D